MQIFWLEIKPIKWKSDFILRFLHDVNTSTAITARGVRPAEVFFQLMLSRRPIYILFYISKCLVASADK